MPPYLSSFFSRSRGNECDQAGLSSTVWEWWFPMAAADRPRAPWRPADGRRRTTVTAARSGSYGSEGSAESAARVNGPHGAAVRAGGGAAAGERRVASWLARCSHRHRRLHRCSCPVPRQAERQHIYYSHWTAGHWTLRLSRPRTGQLSHLTSKATRTGDTWKEHGLTRQSRYSATSVTLPGHDVTSRESEIGTPKRCILKHFLFIAPRNANHDQQEVRNCTLFLICDYTGEEFV